MTIKIFDPAHPNGVAYRSFAEAGLTKFVNDYSMHFASGSSALVNAGNRAAFEYTDAFSITGWLWLDAGTTDGTILARMGVDRGLKLYLSSSYLTLDLIHSAGDQLSGYAPTKVWDEGGFYFFGVTYDGSNAASTGLKFYLTGALDGCTVNDESVSGSIVESNVDLIIGYGFDGYLDELGIWRGAHTLTEIENLYITQIPKHLGRYASPASSRLVHYFRMGDSYLAPGLIIDEVTGGYATIVNATRETDIPTPFTPDPPPVPVLPSPTAYWKFDDGPWVGWTMLVDSIPPGLTGMNPSTHLGLGTAPPLVNGGTSCQLDGVTDWKGGASILCPTSFTMQLWITDASQMSTVCVMDAVDLSAYQPLLTLLVMYPYLYIQINGGAPQKTLALHTMPKHLIIVTYDSIAATVTLSFDGAPAFPLPWTPNPSSYGGVVVADIGKDLFGSYGSYVGPIDDAAFWIGTPLSPANITYIWNGGAGNPLI